MLEAIDFIINKIFLNYYKLIAEGMMNTILLAIVGTTVGFVIGLSVGMIRAVNIESSDSSFVRFLKKLGYFITTCYIEIFRSTPMMIQAMFLYYGLRSSLNWSPLIAGMVIISINTGAYMAEIIRSGIQSVDAGQSEAARSIGMSAFQTMRYVVLPQAIRNAFPSIGNEFIVNLKDSCVLSAIGLVELFQTGKTIAGSIFNGTPVYFTIALIYFVITFSTSKLLGVLEKRLGYKEKGIKSITIVEKEAVK